MTYDVWKFYFIHSGCDDLLPILSFVIIRSGMAQLISECDAMEEFIPEGWVRGTFNYLRVNELTREVSEETVVLCQWESMTG